MQREEKETLLPDVSVGQVWQRKPPYKQRFRVWRVWTPAPGWWSGIGMNEPQNEGKLTVTLVRLNGGGPSDWVSTVDELHKNCVLVGE